jgi:methylated-DNA-[protein]-cysteine S-methyltransferase/AraC family transcriptional regulator of adaptative response/methylated-DNA-[protein]-cysteine methyltransferase
MSLINTDISSRPILAMKSQDTETPNDIAFSIGECTLGEVLVARSSVGVCAILIGSDVDELKNDLSARFPGGKLISDESQLRDDLSKVLRFIETPSEGLDLALDMRGTPFQRRVWDALRAIPVGTTVTYTELARRIGEPKSARAVASACASNAIALAVPCHRVVRHDGTLSGYRWGVERKRDLLLREARP